MLFQFVRVRRLRPQSLRRESDPFRPNPWRAGSCGNRERREAVSLAGIALGVPVALGSARACGEPLLWLSASDPATLAAATGILILIALLADAVPGSRATRVEPSKPSARSSLPASAHATCRVPARDLPAAPVSRLPRGCNSG
jgi:hypothetical protein